MSESINKQIEKAIKLKKGYDKHGICDERKFLSYNDLGQYIFLHCIKFKGHKGKHKGINDTKW